jgi:hypothetical protein
MLSTAILLLTCGIIIGACFGIGYFMYKQVFMREQYHQFDEEQDPAAAAPAERTSPVKKLTIEDLKHIESQINYDKSNRNTSHVMEGGQYESGANYNASYKIEQEIK